MWAIFLDSGTTSAPEAAMSLEPQTLVYQTFRGKRFEDHGIDLEVLEDVLRYQHIVAEVAKSLWRREHPERTQLPKNFEKSLALKVYELKCNCVTLPLARPTDRSQLLASTDDELIHSVELVNETIASVGDGRSIPPLFPKEHLGLFGKYGTTLLEDEWIELRPELSGRVARFSQTVRSRFEEIADKAYTSDVLLRARVTMARINRPKMAVQLSDGREIEAPFLSENEIDVLTALREHQTTLVQIHGSGQHAPDGKLVRLLRVDRITLLREGVEPIDLSVKPIWEQLVEFAETVPEEMLADLPTDGAENLDKYLYGRRD